MSKFPSPTTQEPVLLTPKETAVLLKIKPHTLAVWRCQGDTSLPWIKVGRLVRYRTVDVNDYVAKTRDEE